MTTRAELSIGFTVNASRDTWRMIRLAGAEFLVTENEDEAKEISNFKKKTYQAQKILSNDKSKLFDKEEEKMT